MPRRWCGPRGRRRRARGWRLVYLADRLRRRLAPRAGQKKSRRNGTAVVGCLASRCPPLPAWTWTDGLKKRVWEDDLRCLPAGLKLDSTCIKEPPGDEDVGIASRRDFPRAGVRGSGNLEYVFPPDGPL